MTAGPGPGDGNDGKRALLHQPGGDAARLAPTTPVVTTVTIPQSAITIGSTGTAQVTAQGTGQGTAQGADEH